MASKEESIVYENGGECGSAVCISLFAAATSLSSRSIPFSPAREREDELETLCGFVGLGSGRQDALEESTRESFREANSQDRMAAKSLSLKTPRVTTDP